MSGQATAKVFSWVNQPESKRPAASGPGRYSRPLSERDKIVAAAFGDEVRRLRTAAGMSTRTLARLVGLSQPAIVYVEKHRANVELRLIWDFAEALAVEPTQFIAICDRAVTLASLKRKDRQETGTLRPAPAGSRQQGR